MPAEQDASVEERSLRIKLNDIELKMFLNEKWLCKPFKDAVCIPFLKAYNQRSGKKPVAMEDITRVKLNGAKVERFTTITKELVNSDDIRAELFAGKSKAEAQAEEAAAKARRELAAADNDPQRLQFYKKVEMNWAVITRTHELPWSNLHLDAEDMQVFAQILKDKGVLLNVTDLYFYSNEIGDDGLAVLAPVIKEFMPKVTNIYLHSNEISHWGLRSFLKHLPQAELINLTFWRNELGDEGLQMLSKAVGSGELRVKSLIVHQNGASAHKEGLKNACHEKDVQVSV
eukprot:CAMPEP_0119333034 /NCGR_PEP_ID=MMETSP1333-20130426/84213_1 /TAXON_ID=418940 /ORGANISM="Scyphosphaera apsteinii, Strain RCC1455" /LENGTH=286 /DNA_ID=CAMNT_0007342981 /DNA_START=46 /DNA_END=906 /DNA_ORIENTATION=-